MNECERTEELLVELLERELSSHEQDQLESHLLLCAFCREMERQNQAIRAAYASGPAADVGGAVAAAILEAAQELPKHVRRRPRTLTISALLAAAILVMIVGVKVLSKSHDSPGQGEPLANIEALIAEGDYDQALDQLALMEGHYTDEAERLRALHLWALALEGKESWNEAIEAYERLAREFPSELEEARQRSTLMERMLEEAAMQQLRGLGYAR